MAAKFIVAGWRDLEWLHRLWRSGAALCKQLDPLRGRQGGWRLCQVRLPTLGSARWRAFGQSARRRPRKGFRTKKEPLHADPTQRGTALMPEPRIARGKYSPDDRL